MSSQSKIVPITSQKVSNPELIQQIMHNTNSTKLLSPFTWSHLHIKLPKLPVSQNKPQQFATIVEQDQKKTHVVRLKHKSKKTSNDHKKVKLQTINKTIHIQTHMKKQTQSENNKKQDKGYSRYNKESLENMNESVNLDFNQRYIRHNPQNLRQYKRDLITRHLQKAANRNQSQKQSIINRPSADITRARSPASVFSVNNPNHCAPQTFYYNKIQNYIYRALIKSNWCQVPQRGPPLPQLIWSDHYIQSSSIKQAQIHNHINNSHFLTTKNNLHELQSAIGSEHYPISFIMPFQYQNFCEEYEQNMVKICLKDIIRKAYPKLIENNVTQKVGLATILQNLKNKNNISDQTFMTIKLCLYLQNYRRIKNYRHFEPLDNHTQIQTNLQLSVLSTLLKACHEYHQQILKQSSIETPTTPYFSPSQMPQDLLHILHIYHKILLKNQPSYQNLSIRNQWIVKPIASSRGAGISLLKNSQEFFTINYDRFQYSNKIKFGNKIIQKYVQLPRIIGKKGVFEGRKFDIRQWVLVTCDCQTLQPLIYIFQDAYCRFSDMKFTYNHYRSQQAKIHLTNYSVSDKTNPEHSLLLLSQLFSDYMPELQKCYRPQLSKIIIQTILNCQDLKFQPNRFQLLGYDLIFDQFQKLWLLEINLNPACEASRSKKLETMADKMVFGMMKIVKGACGKSVILGKEREKLGWNLIYGQEKFRQVQLEDIQNQAKIRPFYALSLGSQSLVEEVRKRNIMMNAILKTITRCNLRDFWKTLVLHEGFPIQEKLEQENVQPQLDPEIKQEQVKQKQIPQPS